MSFCCVTITMELIGPSGFKEEGRQVYLFQCPKCKRVEYNTIDGE